eukprot:scaffold37984_cov40-Phaeocystis_antarctica.AAC.1
MSSSKARRRSSTAPGCGQRGTVSTHASARWDGCVASAPRADRSVPWVLQSSRRSDYRWASRTRRGLSGFSAAAPVATATASAAARATAAAG